MKKHNVSFYKAEISIGYKFIQVTSSGCKISLRAAWVTDAFKSKVVVVYLTNAAFLQYSQSDIENNRKDCVVPIFGNIIGLCYKLKGIVICSAKFKAHAEKLT